MGNLAQKVFSDNLKVTSGQVIFKVSSIVFLIFYARVLTPFELSVLPIFAIIGGMSTLLFNFGLFPTLIREVPKLLEKDKSRAISLLHTSFFLSGLNQILTYAMRATSEFGKMVLRNITLGIAQRLLGIALFFIWGIKGLIIGFNLGIGIGVVMSLYFLRSYIFRRFRWYPIKKLLKFSFPYYIESFLMYFRSQGDQLIVGTFLSPAALSAYYVARRLFANLDLFRESIAQTIAPALARISDSKQQRIEQSFKKINNLLSYFAIPLCFLAASLSFAFVNLVGGEKYLNAMFPAAILCFTLLLYFFLGPLNGAVLVLGKPVERFKITAVQSFSILLFLTLLIRNFGISGAAFSQLLAITVTLVYSYFTLRKLMVIRLDIRAIGNSFFASAVMASVISFAQVIFYKLYLIPLYAFIGVFAFFLLFIKMLRNEDLEIIEDVLPMRIKSIIKILYWFRPDLRTHVERYE